MKHTYLVSDDTARSRMGQFIRGLFKGNNGSLAVISLTEQGIATLNEYPDAECFVALFSEEAVDSRALHGLVAYCEVQHIPMIPIFVGTTLKPDVLPDILRSRHILRADDPFLLEKTLLAIKDPTFIEGSLNDQILEAHELWKNGCRSCMTAQQLFSYALGLLYGIEVERDLLLSIRLQTYLIGNEVFEPKSLIFDHVRDNRESTAAIYAYADALNQYFKAEVQRLEAAADYRSVEKLLEYGYLLQRISSQFWFGFHVDSVLHQLKRVMILWCVEDHSAVAGRWLTRYFWGTAERAADNRRYEKMLDDLLEVLFYGSRVLEKHDDTQTKLYMLRASAVLGLYAWNRPELVEKAIKIRTLDEYEEDNTFRPANKTRVRSTQETQILRELVSRYTCWKREVVTKYFAEKVYSEYRDILDAIRDVVKVLIWCKCNCASDYLSVLFYRNMNVVIQSLPPEDVDAHRWILVWCSSFAQALLHAPRQTAPQALLHAASHMEQFYDRHEPKWVGMETDKSQIYAMYCDAYQEMKQYALYDEYKLHLFEIVSQRDHGDPDKIRSMLIDCFNTAMRRKKRKTKDRCIEYLRFGWKCCQSYQPIPAWLDDIFEAYHDEAIRFRL